MRACAYLTAAALCFVSTDMCAQPSDVDELQIELEILRREVKSLRLRIESLEVRSGGAAQSTILKQPSTQQTNVQSPAQRKADEQVTEQAVTLMRRWSKVASGMTGHDVEEAIGEPEAKFIIDGRPVWYYSYAGVGRGSVMFDGGGRVSSLQAPVAAWESLFR